MNFELLPIARPCDLAADWSRLEDRESTSFFTSWAWIGTWLDSLPEHIRPHLLRISESGTPIGMAIVVPRKSRRRGIIRVRGLYVNATGEPSLDCITIEHNGFLAAPLAASRIFSQLLAWFATREDEDELIIPGADFEPRDAGLKANGLIGHSRAVPTFSVDLSRLAAVRGDPAAMLGRNSRQQLRRAIRRYEREGPLHIAEAADTAEALRWLAVLKQLHVASWSRRGKSHAFSQPYFERFHQALIGRHFDRGHIQLLRITAGTHAIGYLYNFRHKDRIYAYQSGFADSDRTLHPGYVSHALALTHNYERGAQRYDFLAGANRLKETFATERGLMFWQVLQRPKLGFRVETWARTLRDRLRRV